MSKAHVYRLTRDDRSPTIRKLDRYYRYRLDAIERYEAGEDRAAALTCFAGPRIG